MKALKKYLSKKEYIIFMISILVILLSSFSYAYFYIVEDTDENIAKSDCLKLTIVDNNDINIDKGYPLNEEEGEALTPYEFTIKNTCNAIEEYEINIETLMSSTINTNNIRIKVDDEESKILGEQEEVLQYINSDIKESRKLKTGTLDAKQEITYNIRMWIDEDSKVEEIADKIFKSKVVISAIPKLEIELKPNEGEVVQNILIREIGKQIGRLEEPIREDYEFIGWYSDLEYTQEINENTIVENSMTKLYAKWKKNCEYNTGDIVFQKSSTGKEEVVNISPKCVGNYKLEVWGAQGGGKQNDSSADSSDGGKGGYSLGEIQINNETNLYVYIGKMGSTSLTGKAEGGFNGGGSAWGSSSSEPGNGGGGATDIRVGSNSLKARVIVAGGGGGAGEDSGDTPGYGGGTSGGTSSGHSTAATQTSTGTGGQFGYGAHTSYDGGGGGGGWYGGGTNGGQTSAATSNSTSDTSGGCGGSGYVYTSSTASNYPSGCLLNSSYYLTNAQTIAGNTSFTAPTGGSETGHSGDGYARITYLENTIKPPKIVITKKGTKIIIDITSANTIYGYGINQSTMDEPEYIELNSKNPSITWKPTEVGTYFIWVKDVNGKKSKKKIILDEIPKCDYTINQKFNFDYIGSVQTFKPECDGRYKLEVWGAQGGYRSSETYGGKGGYSYGEIKLTSNTNSYVYVGGSGNSGTCSSSICKGGYNGGGYRYSYKGGGGATDIRIGQDSLYARVIVAGGGGSDGATKKTGMYGGGTSGGSSSESYTAYSNYCGKGGTQTYSGYSSSYTISSQTTSALNSNTLNNYAGGFGFGGGGTYLSNGYGGAGGGGWYGGAGTIPDGSQDDDRGGGGGSGYVYTSSTASNYPSGCLLNSSYYLTNAQTIAGDTSFDAPTGGTETGHSGNGYARITYLGE